MIKQFNRQLDQVFDKAGIDSGLNSDTWIKFKGISANTVLEFNKNNINDQFKPLWAYTEAIKKYGELIPEPLEKTEHFIKRSIDDIMERSNGSTILEKVLDRTMRLMK